MKHSLDPLCPCETCARDRFEARATLAIILALFIAGSLGLLFLGAP